MIVTVRHWGTGPLQCQPRVRHWEALATPVPAKSWTLEGTGPLSWGSATAVPAKSETLGALGSGLC